MNMYILWIGFALLTGTFIRTLTRDERKESGKKPAILRAGRYYYLDFRGFRISLTILAISLALFICLGVINDLTYAAWIGSVLGFLWASIFFLIAPLYMEYLMRNQGKIKKRIGTGTGRSSSPVVLTVTGERPPMDWDRGRPVSLYFRAGVWLIAIMIGILSNITPLTGNLDFNPVFNDLNATENNDKDADVHLTDIGDVRVISWNLATQYLQRAYSDAASTLSTDQAVLDLNTDPDYVNGKFVWVNAPQFETLKWLGGKDVPFFVYVVNDPENMSNEGFEVVHRSNESIEVQREKITWGHRIDQILHDRYAGEYVKIQIRINLDDNYHPYWVVYLGKRHVLYDVVDLKKILIIDAENMDNHTEYDIHSPNIPDWLEVVYPDNYLMDWARLWGEWRNGISYKWFNKRHLTSPDDTPRFIILNRTAYWYLPMRQLNSKVLGGYILMNTRTGETTYYNRETRSLADRYTARLQVGRYLSSGVQGYRKLTIQEGYLYPILMNNGRVREAYIFPLYSGFTIQQYAIVDARYYTLNPFLGPDLNSLLDEYRTHTFEEEQNITYVWQNLTFESAYADDEEGAFTSNNTTYVVVRSELSGGVISDADDEWREFRLAVSDFERGKNVTIACTVQGNRVLDVDYGRADLVNR